MREIKFRGMDIVNNKWLYGNLEIPLINQSKSKHFIVGHFYGQYQKLEVNPKTVGQYTGLKDKNGKDIYEGDIYHMGDPSITYTVVWHDAGLIGKQNGSSSYAGLSHWQDRIEVIGNIYENPSYWRVKNENE